MNPKLPNGLLYPCVTEGDCRAHAAQVVLVDENPYIARLEAFALHSHHPARSAVSALRTYDLHDGRCYLTADGDSGFAILPGGALVGLFSFVRGRGGALVAQAVRRGAHRLECYALPALVQLYKRAGFREVARFPFDPEAAERRFDQGALGQPDYLHMEWANV